MHAVCAQESFAQAVRIVSTGRAVGSCLPILGRLLVTATDGGLSVYATDLDVIVERRIPAQVAKPGAALLPGGIAAKFAKLMPAGELAITGDDRELRLDMEGAAFRARQFEGERDEFPSALSVEWSAPIAIPLGKLRAMLARTLSVVLREDSRPFMEGVLWEFRHEALRLVATDINRLAIVEYQMAVGQEATAVISGACLRKVLKAFHHMLGAAEIKVSLSPKHVRFASADTAVTVRRMECEYPVYEQVIPETFVMTADIDRLALSCALARVGVVDETVRLQFYANELEISDSHSDLIEAGFEQHLPVKTEGERLQSVFSAAYLLDFVRRAAGDTIRIGLTGPTDRALLSAPGDPGYRYVVMPYQVNL